MRYSFILLSTIILFNLSCKKSPSTLVTSTKDTLTYQPITADSKWEYDVFVGGVKTSSNSVICLSRDTTFNAKSYDVFLNMPDSTFSYNRASGANYYNVLSTSTNKTELLILDTTKNIGETWVGGTNGSDTYNYTITEKLTNYLQDGVTYKRVLKVSQERKNASGNVTLSGDTYYAQGVGQIKIAGQISGITVEYRITQATIK